MLISRYFFMKQLFVKKPIEAIVQNSEQRSGLKRTLGSFNLTTIGIGAIIGAGLFVLTGQAAAQFSGPGVFLSFVIAAVICLFAALCYAELASCIPVAGSAYTYAYASLGEFAAWLIGWGLTLEYLLSASTVAAGFSGYFVSLMRDFGIHLPEKLTQPICVYDQALGWSASGNLMNLPALVIVGAIGVLISYGIKTVSFFNNILVVLKIAVILLFVFYWFGYINLENLHPLIPENQGHFGQYGVSGLFRGAGFLFFAFIGFDALSTLAQEARNPQKDLPLGMLSSLGISTIVYIIVAIILVGIVPYKELGVADPIAVAFNALGPKFLWLRIVVKLAILAGLSSVILVLLLGQTRIWFAMAKDGLLPKAFGVAHSKTGTPVFASLIATCIAMLMASFFPVEMLGQLVSMGALLAFGIVCLGVLVLRYAQPQLVRPFKTPFFPWVPILGALSCFLQMALMPGTIWAQLLIWMAFGCIFYFTYSHKKSKLRVSFSNK